MIGQLLEDYLASPIHTFTHPEDALKNLPSLQPGIIITDYYMPGMSGLDLIRAVQPLLPQIPCVLITGHPFNWEDHAGDAGLRNLKAVLPKPFRWQQLADTIERHWSGATPLVHRLDQNLF